jgi:hypothetical protein
VARATESGVESRSPAPLDSLIDAPEYMPAGVDHESKKASRDSAAEARVTPELTSE